MIVKKYEGFTDNSKRQRKRRTQNHRSNFWETW